MRFSELLLEYDRSKAMAAFGGKLQARIASDPKVESIEELFTQLEQADPSINKQYVNWLVRAYQAGSKLEDLTSRGHDSLEKFELLKKHKQLPADKTDIGKYLNLKALEDELVKYEVKKPELIQVDRGKYKILADTPNIRIIIPEDETAAKFWGQGTRWCTAAKNNNMFNEYDNRGKLYIIIPKHPKYPGEKYQFHFETDSFMNEKDEEIDLFKFVDEYPETKKYFAKKCVLFKNTPSEEEQIKFVLARPSRIKFIQNPSEALQKALIEKSAYNILYIKNPSEALQLLAIKNTNGNAFTSIKNPSEKAQLLAVGFDGWLIEGIKNPSEKVQLAAINKNPIAIQFIKNPSEQVQLEAIKLSGYPIRYIKNPSESIQLTAVKGDMYAIQYINNPSEAVQLAAVSRDGWAVRYIKNPSEAVQLAAIAQNSFAIRGIKNPTRAAYTLADQLG